MKKATDPVSARAVARIKRARDQGFELMFFAFRACCDQGIPIFAATQVGDTFVGFRYDGTVSRIGMVSPERDEQGPPEDDERALELANHEWASQQTALDEQGGMGASERERAIEQKGLDEQTAWVESWRGAVQADAATKSEIQKHNDRLMTQIAELESVPVEAVEHHARAALYGYAVSEREAAEERAAEAWSLASDFGEPD